MAPLSAFIRLVAWRWKGCTELAGSHTFVHGAGDDVVPRSSFLHVLALDVKPLGPNTSLFLLFRLVPLLLILLSWSQVPSFVPE